MTKPTPQQAREALAQPLVFGDERQIAALRLLAAADEARELALSLYPGKRLSIPCLACEVEPWWPCEICAGVGYVSLPLRDEIAIELLPWLQYEKREREGFAE